MPVPYTSKFLYYNIFVNFVIEVTIMKFIFSDLHVCVHSSHVQSQNSFLENLGDFVRFTKILHHENLELYGTFSVWGQDFTSELLGMC